MPDMDKGIPFEDIFADSREAAQQESQEQEAPEDNEEGVSASEDVNEEETNDETADAAEEESKEASDAEESKDSDVDWEKRFKDTQKWANELRQQLTDINKKIEAGEELSAEDMEALKNNSINEDNPMASVMEQFQVAYPVLKADYEARGETPDLYVEAFDKMATQDTLDELKTLPKERQVPFILNKGKEFSEDYSLLKEHGSVQALIKALREQAMEDAKKALKEEQKDSSQKKSSSRPKLKGESSKSASSAPKALSFDQIFNRQ